MNDAAFTRADPACRKILARLRLRRWQMRREGIRLAMDGAPVTPASKTDVRITWKRHGWRRPAGKRPGAARSTRLVPPVPKQ
jgi:hypothetical protein